MSDNQSFLDEEEGDYESNSSVAQSESDGELEDLSQDRHILSHPIFSFKEDPLISTLIAPIDGLLNPDSDSVPEELIPDWVLEDFSNRLSEFVFMGKDTSELKKINIYDSSICGKNINKDDLYVRCLDCDIHPHPNMYCLLCLECFENSNHADHRIIMIKSSADGASTCDCGDIETFKSEGFCKKHQHKTANMQDIYSLFPSDVLKQYVLASKKGVYGAASLLEIWSKARSGTVKEFVWGCFVKLVDILLKFWNDSSYEINKAFLPILWTTLKTGMDAPYNLLWHDCEDLTGVERFGTLKQEASPCSCSLLGILLRMNNILQKGQQNNLKKMLLECMKDTDFRGYLAGQFMKYLLFMFSDNFKDDEEEEEDDEYEDEEDIDEFARNSSLLSMIVHLYSKEEILISVQDSVDFQHVVALMKKIVEGAFRPTKAMFNAMNDIQTLFRYFLLPKFASSTLLAQKPEFLRGMLEANMTFQMKFFYEGEEEEKINLSLHEHQIVYKPINYGLMVQRILLKPLEASIKLLCSSKGEKAFILQDWLQQWYTGLQTAKMALADGEQSFLPGLERIFCCVITSSLKDNMSKEGLEKCLKEILPGINQQELGKNVLEGVLRALGLVRYIHLVHSFQQGEIYEVYYFVTSAFFETDIATIQFMLMLMNGENLFEILAENYFSYYPELLEFFNGAELKGEHPKRSLLMIEDFLNLIIYLMNDEICLLNARLKYAKDCIEELNLSSRDYKMIEKMLINLLHGHYWVDINEIKNSFEDLVNITQGLNSTIAKITIQDEKNHKIRLRDQYQSEFDPYMFYKDPSLKQNIVSGFASKPPGSLKDIVSGVFDRDQPRYLKDIQRNIFRSSLPNFLGYFIKKFDSQTSSMLPSVLKLILLNLQVGLEEEEDIQDLKKKIEENYGNTEFGTHLAELGAQEEFKDCGLCIKKIQDLLVKGKGKMIIEEEEEKSSPTKEDKKKLAKERMAKMKENFAMKQNLFVEKNLEFMENQEESKEMCQNQKEDQKVCQHCMEGFSDSEEEYGLPVHITFTNNFYEKNNPVFKEEDYSKDILSSDWWPVVSSCHHYYHKKCFDTLYKSPPEDLADLFYDKWETCCPLCKRVANNFLCVNKKKQKMEEEIPQEEIDANPQIYLSFMKKLEQSFMSLLQKLNPQRTFEDLNSDLLIEELFERSYQYFIEGVDLSVANSQRLHQNLLVYQLFFTEFSNVKYHENKDQKGFSFFEKDRIESSISQIFAYILVNKLDSIESLRTDCLSVLKELILVKICHFIAFQDPPCLVELSECFDIYQKNQTLKQNVIEQLILPFQKILLAYLLNLSILKNQQQIIPEIHKPEIGAEEYLTSLVNIMGLSGSFPILVNDAFSELKDRPQNEKDQLKILLESRLMGRSVDYPQNFRLSPASIHLPEDYQEFSQKYVQRKCGLCKKFSHHLFTAVCLICGDVMCVSYCGDELDDLGNLNIHARKYHMGMGAFLYIHHMQIFLLNSPLAAYYKQKNLYIDNIGHDMVSLIDDKLLVELKAMNFQEFKLNKELIGNIQKTIQQQDIRKEVFALAHNNDERIEGNAL